VLSFSSGVLDNMVLNSLVEAKSTVWICPDVIFTSYKSPKRKINYFFSIYLVNGVCELVRM
jgi:hypothetical protein